MSASDLHAINSIFPLCGKIQRGLFNHRTSAAPEK